MTAASHAPQRLALTLLGSLVAAPMIFAWQHPATWTVAPPRAVLALDLSIPLPLLHPPVDVEPLADPDPVVRAPTQSMSDRLAAAFDRLGYDLAQIREGAKEVPRIFLASMPPDMSDLREPQTRKMIFLQAVLPLILRVNDEIRTDRRRLWSIRYCMQAGTQLARPDRLWLDMMAERYDVARGDVAELMIRVDIIPPSLALAQAAEESGWGTSRFAREGNALFGQYTTNTDGNLVPDGLDRSRGIRIQAFPSLLESVRAYALNLNTHRAYRGFRGARAEMRAEGRTVEGETLAGMLTRYSARGQAYVSTLQVLIRSNGLAPLDGARLADVGEDGHDA